MDRLDAVYQGEKALSDELNRNEAYIAWYAQSNAHERNWITRAVNEKDADYRKKLSPGAAAFFDYLWACADLYEKHYDGVRPTWDMEELE